MKSILFSTLMVQAILSDRKSATRRVIKPQPVMDESGMWHWKDCQWMDGGIGFPASGIKDYAQYKPGDVLWVRETWCAWWLPHGEWHYCYKATEPHGNMRPTSPEYDAEQEARPWRPSIHMPREAARLFLRVTDVRVERLQDITDDGARKEGTPIDWPMDEVYCPKCKGHGTVDWIDPVTLGHAEVDCPYCERPTQRYMNLWDSLYAKRGYGWDANPWVWVIEFEHISKEVFDAERHSV